MNFTRKGNRIQLLPNHAVIICGRYRVKIDRSKVPLVQAFTWRVVKHPRVKYCVTTMTTFGRRQQIQIARMVLGLQFGDSREPDHKNRNGLDNRAKNLRIATPQQNGFHRQVSRNKTSASSSRYKGVSRNMSGNWRATITYNQTAMHLGTFRSERQAALVYNRKARELYGKWALVNRIQ